MFFTRTEKLVFALFVAFMIAMSYVSTAHAQSNFVIPRAMGQGFSSNVRPAPTYVDVRQLAANVNETHTFPAGTRMVIFSADCNFYAKPGGAAAVPAGDVVNGTGSELNPSAWYFAVSDTATQTVGLIAATACNITLSSYKGNLQ